MSTIERTVSLPMRAESAFWYLTDGPSVATIFGAQRAMVEPRQGGMFEVYFRLDSDVDSTKGCKITDFKKDERLVAEFRGPTEHRPFDFMVDTTIAFSVQGDDGSSTLTTRHDGFKQGEQWDEAQRYFEERWDEWAHNFQVLAAFADQSGEEKKKGATGSPVSARPRYDLSSIKLSSIPDIVGPQMANVADQA